MEKLLRSTMMVLALAAMSCACPEKKTTTPDQALPSGPATPPGDPGQVTVPANPDAPPGPGGPGGPGGPAESPPGIPLPAAAGLPCDDKGCAPPYTCVKYYGIAGPRGPEFRSCEIPCPTAQSECPKGTKCTTIADGPGAVCR
jgi:hypothetical protein